MRSLVFIALLILWQGIMSLFHIKSYILPQPLDIGTILYKEAPLLTFHSLISLAQVLLGLAFGCILAFISAVLLDLSHKIEKITIPYLIAFKNLPIFVLAPIFFIWFGYGLTSKVILITLSCYFPMALSLLDGLRHIPQATDELLKSISQKNYFRTLFYIRMPYAMPQFFTGMKLAFIHAPVSVIACDWIGAQSGLGYLLMLSYARMDLEFMFGILFLLWLYGIFLYKFVHFLQKIAIKHLGLNQVKGK